MPTTKKPIGQSNLDMTKMRLVKRGALVSWHGFRFRISKVNRGICYPDFPIELTNKMVRFLPCASVQVVAYGLPAGAKHFGFLPGASVQVVA